MAQKAKKELAKANAQALATLHRLSLVFNGLFVVVHLAWPYVSRTDDALLDEGAAAHRSRIRTWALFFVLSMPAWICEVILERTGRPSSSSVPAATNAPSYGRRETLLRAGQDLSAPGLTEFLWDVVWLTWACLVLVVLAGDRGWLLWGAVPGIAVYKAWGLLGVGRQMLGMAQMGPSGAGQADPGTAKGGKVRRR